MQLTPKNVFRLMKSPYFSDYFCEKIIVIDKILAFPWLFKVRSLMCHYRGSWELGTIVVVTSSKEDICRELMSK